MATQHVRLKGPVGRRFVALLGLTCELWVLPLRWSFRLRKTALPQFLDELEAEARSGAPVLVSVARIAKLVDWRTKLTASWRRNRCLLRSCLLANLLVRAGVPVTLHIAAKSVKGRVRGHSWITSPALGHQSDPETTDDLKEIFSKTVEPAVRFPS
jgi:hypothetical protein